MKKADKIFVLAGHGKSNSWVYRLLPMALKPNDNGAYAWNGTNERDVVVDIVEEIENKRVQKLGVENRLNLNRKIHAVNAICEKYDLDHTNSILIELHANTGGRTSNTGVECWYFGGSNESKKLADCISKSISEATGLKKRRSRADTSNRYGRLGIVRDTLPLAVLIECGFMGNPHDLSIMINNPEVFAKAIMQGINNYLK